MATRGAGKGEENGQICQFLKHKIPESGGGGV